MTSKWDRIQSSFARAHDDLYPTGEYSCEFFNYSTGTYDPATGEMINQSRSSIGSVDVEIVPPSMDTTIDNDGTDFDWDTSIRFPESDKPGDLVPLGEDSERPTEVELTDPEESSTDPEESSTDVFELHGYSYEKGSAMLMCRLVEQ